MKGIQTLLCINYCLKFYVAVGFNGDYGISLLYGHG